MHAVRGKEGAFWALLGPGVELRHTFYDVEAAVESFRRSGVPDPYDLDEILFAPPDPDEASAELERQAGR